MKKNKTVLQDYAKEVHSGAYIHPRSEAIYNGDSYVKEEKKPWFIPWMKEYGTPIIIVMIVAACFGYLYQRIQINKPIVFTSYDEQHLDMIKKIEVVKEMEEVPVVAPSISRHELDQQLALAKLKSNETMLAAHLAHQDKLIKEIIKKFYASGAKGRLCVSWGDKMTCKDDNGNLESNLSYR